MCQTQRVLSPYASADATGKCSTFQRQARSAAKAAILFLRRVFRIKLPDKDLIGDSCQLVMKDAKEFFSLPLIASLAGSHYFTELDEERSFSAAASMASALKAFPLSCECMEDSLLEEVKKRQTAPARQLPRGYISFVRSEVRKLFPKGIRAEKLAKRAELVVPPVKSTTSAKRSEGGSYASWHGRRGDYLSGDTTIVHEPQLMVANAPGKPRPLAKNDPSYLLLKPLHKYLYDRISNEPWLLRGPPKVAAFRKAGLKESQGFFFSADFTAATDNLPIEVAEAIIEELIYLSELAVVPILLEAKRSLRPMINGEYQPTTGQMMGNLLSFPLLCMQNHFSFKFFCGDLPHLINGDDLLFQGDLCDYYTYKEGVGILGFELNEKKTMISESFFTMNSTYFRSDFRRVPILRLGGLLTRDPRELASAFSSIVSEFRTHRLRYRVYKETLRFFSRRVCSSRRTMYALGFRMSRTDCIPKNLYQRERRRYVIFEGKVKKKVGQFHTRMIHFDGHEGAEVSQLMEDREIAERVVKETWELGPYEPDEQVKLKDLMKELRANPTTRGTTNSELSMERLRLVEKGKTAVVPESIADCFLGLHDTVRLRDGWFEYDQCSLCERVRQVQFEKTKEKLAVRLISERLK